MKSPWMRTLFALTPPVAITIVAALAGLVLVRSLVPTTMLQPTNDVAGNFLQTLGTIYAVLLAFVVFVVWQQFNDARIQVEREANNLLDLDRSARGLPVEEHRALHTQVMRYVDQVVAQEWPAMVRGKMAALDEGWHILEAMADAVRRCRPHDDLELAHLSDLLARLADLSDARSDRIASSTLRVPRAMRFLLYAGAFMTVGSLYLFAVDSFALHAILVAVLAGAISHVLYLIRDLDDVFSGDFMVTPAAFERVRRHIVTEVFPVTAADNPRAAP